MQFAARHSYFKRVVSDVDNFKNILLTLATKHQLMMAHILNGPSLFSPVLSVQKIKFVTTCTLDVQQKTAVLQKYPHRGVVSLTSDVHLNGIHYSKGIILSSGQLSGLPEFFWILSIRVNGNTVSLICWKLVTWYVEHYRCYEVSEMCTTEILEPEDLNHPLIITHQLITLWSCTLLRERLWSL